MKLLAHMKEDSHQVITLYYGEDVKEDEAAALCEKIAEKYPDCRRGLPQRRTARLLLYHFFGINAYM